ncbi:F-box protein [Actinidia chinensis var. chinensis]|uniref:F-box protein n=1 Tax=Actinidia chinensis var. chinensis TaxID=1590841 RepID=A0A2R6PX28_ACTCC|nr:F-box protein [Actinidia chinensis var. chinensis]
MREAREMGLDSVGGLANRMIMAKLGPEGTGSLACVSRRFRDWADDDSLWSTFCADELHLPSPLDPLGNPMPTFKAAYQVWREAFGMYPWPLVTRVKRCWDRLKSWLVANFPEALSTLRKGASEDKINKLENALQVNLPVPTRVLYRFCDGQALMSAEFSGHMLGNPLGLIGGYSFYDHEVNVYLLPLSQVVRETKKIARRMGFNSRSEYIVMGNSSTDSAKIFILNCADGQLYVGTRNFARGGLIPCVPNELINLRPDSGHMRQQDAMLLWLEEHGRRLHDGIIKLRAEGNIRSINLFPEQAPHCTAAMTNGVKVRASAVLAPEFSDLDDGSAKYMFSYSIRMSLLPEGCIINGLSFTSCQLYWRHLFFHANDDLISDVEGEAVIGKFPLLHQGEAEFVYESCTPLTSSSGSVEGSFTFVPGSLSDPRGDPFEVELARFPLQLPDYIF